MDALTRHRILALAGFEVRAVEGGGGGGRTYLRDPAGTSTGGQFAKDPNAAKTTSAKKKSDGDLRRGARGEQVRKLQQALTAAGFKTTVDGIFGPKTEASVRAAQKKFGLPVTGIVTPELLRRLSTQSMGDAPGSSQSVGSKGLKSGDRGAEVTDLQRLMSLLGVKTDTDGIYGPKTVASVKAIQRKLGLKETGSASAALIRKMADAARLSPCLGASQRRDLDQIDLEARGWADDEIEDRSEPESEPEELFDDEIDDFGDLDDETDDHEQALARHRELALLGVEVRKFNPLQPRDPGGEGGGQWIKGAGIGGRIAAALAKWVKGDGPDKPLDGLNDREQLRRYARSKGITLRRGADIDEIKESILADARGEAKVVRAADKAKRQSAKFSIDVDGKRTDEPELDLDDDAPGTAVVFDEEREKFRRLPRAEAIAGYERYIKKTFRPGEPAMAVAQERLIKMAKGGDVGNAPYLPMPTKTGKKIDVAVYAHESGKVSLFAQSDSGRRGKRVVTVDDLEGLEEWARDNGHTDVEEWARNERGEAEAAGGQLGSSLKPSSTHRPEGTNVADSPAKPTPVKVDSAPAAILDRLEETLRKLPGGRRKSSPAGEAADTVKTYRERLASGELEPKMLDQLLQRLLFQSRPDSGFKATPLDDSPEGSGDQKVVDALRETLSALRERPAKAAPAKKATPAPDADLTGANGLSSDPAVREVQVENRIRAAYNELPKGAGIWLGLADLREHPLMRDLPRAEVDAALLRGNRTGMQLEPIDNRRGMTQRDHDAALSVGGEPLEMVSFRTPGGGFAPVGDSQKAPLRPLPAPAKKATVDVADAPDPAESLRDELDLKKVPELKAQLKALGLPVSGRKRELVDRLVDAQNAPDASVGRPSGLPTDRRPAAADFEDLAERVFRLKTEDEVFDLVQDLNKTELARLARQFPGDGLLVPGWNKSSGRRQGMKLPEGMTIDELRRWFAQQVKPAQPRSNWR